MTSIQSVLAAFAIILIDLSCRAGLDKALALVAGPATVALWAQLQSLVELVGAVAIAGVLQGLTVLIAQARETRDERVLLGAALKLGLGASAAMALAAALAAPVLADSLAEGNMATVLLAASTGCLATIPATLNAYWLGKHRQQRMLRLALLTGAVWLLLAAGAWMGLGLGGLMLLQFLALAIIGGAIWRHLSGLSRSGGAQPQDTECLRRLARFVPVGLAIGIMSPVSMLLMRAILSGTLSWNDVGILQAMWRASDWVTATSAGVLSLVFLPRFGNAYGTPQFMREIKRAGVMVLVPAACLLLLILLRQRALLATLYDARFAVSDAAAALFMLGSWVRIAAWLFLFGLYAAQRTRLIVAGEVLSLPLYALLLWLYANGMTLERAALLYLLSYLAYLCFNAACVLQLSRRQRRETRS